MQTALSADWGRQPAEVMARAAAQALDYAAVALVVVDQDARLLDANGRGEALLSQGLCIWAGRIGAASAQDTRALRAAIAAATSADEAAALTLCDADGEPSLRLMVVPVRGEPLAMLMTQGGAQDIAPARLRESFDLTPSEARLLSALVAGERLTAYADRLGVRLSTVRTHLRQLFAKTGEQRQADLIRRALTDPVLRLSLA